jgi:hypothetical protein
MPEIDIEGLPRAPWLDEAAAVAAEDLAAAIDRQLLDNMLLCYPGGPPTLMRAPALTANETTTQEDEDEHPEEDPRI